MKRSVKITIFSIIGFGLLLGAICIGFFINPFFIVGNRYESKELDYMESFMKILQISTHGMKDILLQILHHGDLNISVSIFSLITIQK